ELSVGNGECGGPDFLGNLIVGVSQGGYSFNSPPDIDSNTLNGSFGETMLAAKVSSYAQAGGFIPTTIAANVAAANPYNLVLDMNFQAAGITAAASAVTLTGAPVPGGPIPNDVLTITAKRDGANLVLHLDDATNSQLTGDYFVGAANTIGSLTIRGTAGNDTIRVSSDLGVGQITIDGRAGNDTLIIDDAARTANDTYTLTSGQVQRTGA